MTKTRHLHCIKSGLPITNPGVCRMCKRYCHLAGSRGRRYETASQRRRAPRSLAR